MPERRRGASSPAGSSDRQRRDGAATTTTFNRSIGISSEEITGPRSGARRALPLKRRGSVASAAVRSSQIDLDSSRFAPSLLVPVAAVFLLSSSALILRAAASPPPSPRAPHSETTGPRSGRRRALLDERRAAFDQPSGVTVAAPLRPRRGPRSWEVDASLYSVGWARHGGHPR